MLLAERTGVAQPVCIGADETCRQARDACLSLGRNNLGSEQSGWKETNMRPDAPSPMARRDFPTDALRSIGWASPLYHHHCGFRVSWPWVHA